MVTLMQQEVLICLSEVIFYLWHIIIKFKIQNPKLGNLKDYHLITSEGHNVLEAKALQSLEPLILLACMASDLSGEWLF